MPTRLGANGRKATRAESGRRLPAVPPINPPEHDSATAITLVRGLSLLRCFTPQRSVLSNAQLAALSGLGKSTVSRFCGTLCELGYLVCDHRLGRYRIGPAVLSLAYPLLASYRVQQIARGPMQMLANELGASVSIGVRDRLQMIYIETCRSNSRHSPELSAIGMSHPIGLSALGRAYLAGCDASARNAILNQLKVNAPEQFNATRLAASMKEFRDRGFCSSFGEVRPQVHAVGVPFRERISDELFAFNCVVPSFALKRGQLVDEIGPRLLQMVETLSLY